MADVTGNHTDDVDDMLNFDDERQRILIAIITLVASLAGTFGNSLVILSVLLSRKLRSPTNVFVVNLSVADLLTCLALPWNLIALLSFDGWPIADWVCSVAAGILYIPLFCSVITLASIGITRLILITQPVRTYQKIFCTKILCTWIILLWIYPFVVTTIPPLVADFGALGYNERFHSCSSVSSNEFSDEYDLMTAILIYPIPLVTILISYIGIFVYVKRKSSKLNNNHHPSSPTPLSITEDSFQSPTKQHPDNTISIKLKHLDNSTPQSPDIVKTPENANDFAELIDDEPPAELPLSRAVTQLQMDSNTSKTASLPTRKSQYKSPHTGVGRVSSYPGKMAHNGEDEDVTPRKTAKKSLTQRIQITIKEATGFTRISRRQMAITKNMFYVVIAYLICLTPFVFCLVIDTRLSTKLIPYAAALLFFNSCINPAIYAKKHPYFKKIFYCIVRCQWYKIPEPSDTLRSILSKGIFVQK